MEERWGEVVWGELQLEGASFNSSNRINLEEEDCLEIKPNLVALGVRGK